MTRSYLESDNFETELGSSADDPFAEDFSEIQRHEIVSLHLAYLILFRSI
jgi:hypothetical protein